MGDDHLHDLVWQATGRFAYHGYSRRHLWRRTCRWTIDLGFASIPIDHHASDPYSAKVRGTYVHRRGAVLDTENTVPLEWLISLVVGFGAIVAVGGLWLLRVSRVEPRPALRVVISGATVPQLHRLSRSNLARDSYLRGLKAHKPAPTGIPHLPPPPVLKPVRGFSLFLALSLPTSLPNSSSTMRPSHSFHHHCRHR